MKLDINTKIAYKVIDQNNSKFINIVGYSYFLSELEESLDIKYDMTRNAIIGTVKEWESRGVCLDDIENDLKNSNCYII